MDRSIPQTDPSNNSSGPHERPTTRPSMQHSMGQLMAAPNGPTPTTTVAILILGLIINVLAIKLSQIQDFSELEKFFEKCILFKFNAKCCIIFCINISLVTRLLTRPLTAAHTISISTLAPPTKYFVTYQASGNNIFASLSRSPLGMSCLSLSIPSPSLSPVSKIFSPAFCERRGATLAEEARLLNNVFAFVLIGLRALTGLVYQYYYQTGPGPLPKPLSLPITPIAGAVGIETAAVGHIETILYGMSLSVFFLFL